MFTPEELTVKTVPELKKILANLNIKGGKEMKKQDLINLILSSVETNGEKERAHETDLQAQAPVPNASLPVDDAA
ncbi:MAG: Rho termination factor N-terminal domain-containing protein, partial [Bacteroidia bacterium]|nr:Rho termination factor N-terminal domain-containing protein [Bacteroidia bacterium]